MSTTGRYCSTTNGHDQAGTAKIVFVTALQIIIVSCFKFQLNIYCYLLLENIRIHSWLVDMCYKFIVCNGNAALRERLPWTRLKIISTNFEHQSNVILLFQYFYFVVFWLWVRMFCFVSICNFCFFHFSVSFCFFCWVLLFHHNQLTNK